MKQEIALIGLGKMGAGLALQLLEKKWQVVGCDPHADVVARLHTEGLTPAESARDAVQKLSAPRVVWLMVPAGAVIDDILFGENGIVDVMEAGDTIIDGGNSLYTDSIERGKRVQEHGVRFMDVGVSGGPAGARTGACMMVGGSTETFTAVEPLLQALCIKNGYAHFEGIGAGHFTKMVHNGIEYGMMQALAEGFTVLKEAPFALDVREVARIYNTGSVIESRLVGWLEKAYAEYGAALDSISGSVDSTGEGEWTVNTAKEMNVPIGVIEESFQFRMRSKEKPSYTGKVVSALRGQFGGHAVLKKEE